MSRLGLYHEKRDFTKTSEPVGKVQKSGKKLRFCIQFHVARRAHYDFRLEHKGVLLSFAIPKGFSFDPKVKRLAVHVEDHPLDYIDFEGEIAKGNYGAGSVEIFDKGFYVPSFDMAYGLEKGHLKFTLFGEKIRGEFSLVRIDEKNWLLIKSADEESLVKDSSVLPFQKFSPMLATLSLAPPKGKDWLFEIKFDGYRMMAKKEKGEAKCYSRSGIDYTEKFKPISLAIDKLDAESFILDGEVVAFQNGKSDFALLQERLKTQNDDICYVIFDILALNGEDLRENTLEERKNILKRLLAKCDKKLMFSAHVEGEGEKCFEFAKENGLEGIVAKKKNSTYEFSRSESWLKIKCYKRQEFVVCGYEAKKTELGALLLGVFENGKLVFAGKVGTGFSDEVRHELKTKLDKIKAKCPFENFKEGKGVNFVLPKLVAEIQFAERTKSGVLRQASFVGLRSDKKPKDVVWEEEK